jgi:serine/threonine-protein kinase HipA
VKRQDVLYAWREERLVGTLWRGQGERLIGFEYDQAWRDTGHAISFSLPLEQQTWLPEDQRAHRWFGNLLPEEQARAALLKRLAIPDDDFALLAAIGGDCAGALSILPPGRFPSREWEATPLPLDRLAQWAELCPVHRDGSASLPAERRLGAASAALADLQRPGGQYRRARQEYFSSPG